MQTAETADLYEAAYLIICGCSLQQVVCIPTSESLSCRMTLSGEALAKAQDEFFSKKAVVNLHAFRMAYGQVNGFVHQAKKSFDRERRLARHLTLGNGETGGQA
jgi:hypothetical protein